MYGQLVFSFSYDGKHAYNEGRILETNLGVQLEFDRQVIMDQDIRLHDNNKDFAWSIPEGPYNFFSEEDIRVDSEGWFSAFC